MVGPNFHHNKVQFDPYQQSLYDKYDEEKSDFRFQKDVIIPIIESERTNFNNAHHNRNPKSLTDGAQGRLSDIKNSRAKANRALKVDAASYDTFMRLDGCPYGSGKDLSMLVKGSEPLPCKLK